MFREMRRTDKKLTQEESIEILINGEYATLATVSENGYPSIVPLNYVYINDAIYFHCAKEGQKLDNITYNEKVCVSIVSKSQVVPEEFSTNYKSVVVYGIAKEIYNKQKEEALIELVNKYSKGYIKEGREIINRLQDKTTIIKIEITHITGKGTK